MEYIDMQTHYRRQIGFIGKYFITFRFLSIANLERNIHHFSLTLIS